MNGWSIQKLSKVTEIVNGGTPKTTVPDYWDGNINWITPKDLGQIESIFASDTSRTITELGLKKSSAKKVPPNSVILSTRAPIGHLAINTIPMAFNQGCRGIVPDENLHTKYLYYFLYRSKDLLNKLGTGATFKELSARSLKNIEIPIPPFPEQKRIVAILDEAFEAIDQAKAKIERNIQNAEELFQSKLNEIFSQKGEEWEEKKLGDLYHFKNGLNFKKEEKNDLDQVGILTIDVYNMYRGGLTVDLQNLYRVNKNVNDDYLLNRGDILFVRSSLKKEGVAWTTFFTEHKEDVTFCGFIIRGRPLTSINPEYTVYYCRTPKVRHELINRAVQSTVTNINQKLLSQVAIPVPSTEKQVVIVRKIKKIDNIKIHIIDSYKLKVQALEELKKSLLQKAFSGELTANEPMVA